MRQNPGFQPPETIGRRVRVILRNGMAGKGDWAADGRQGCRWSLEGRPFDIAEWEVAA